MSEKNPPGVVDVGHTPGDRPTAMDFFSKQDAALITQIGETRGDREMSTFSDGYGNTYSYPPPRFLSPFTLNHYGASIFPEK